MPFHESIMSTLSSFVSPMLPAQRTGGLPGQADDDDFFGFRPGFDIGDIPDVLGRIFGRGMEPIINGIPRAPTQVPSGPLEGLPIPDWPPGVGAAGPEGFLSDIRARMRARAGNGAVALSGGGGQVTAGTTSMYIGGNCPGLWHTTPVRVVYDRNTGQPRQVGGNTRANRVSLVQNDLGQLEFVAPVKASWSLKYKARRRGTTKRRKRLAAGHHHHHPKRKRLSAGKHRHHPKLTHKQALAGFGGKAAQRRARG